MKLLQSASAFAVLFELSLALPKDYDAIEAADVLHHLLLGPLGMILEAPGDVILSILIDYSL
jgi:hypothetical protein